MNLKSRLSKLEAVSPADEKNQPSLVVRLIDERIRELLGPEEEREFSEEDRQEGQKILDAIKAEMRTANAHPAERMQ